MVTKSEANEILERVLAEPVGGLWMKEDNGCLLPWAKPHERTTLVYKGKTVLSLLIRTLDNRVTMLGKTPGEEAASHVFTKDYSTKEELEACVRAFMTDSRPLALRPVPPAAWTNPSAAWTPLERAEHLKRKRAPSPTEDVASKMAGLHVEPTLAEALGGALSLSLSLSPPQ